MRAVSAIYFQWVGLDDTKRPAKDAHFNRAEGTSSSYQLFMLREGGARAVSLVLVPCLL